MPSPRRSRTLPSSLGRPLPGVNSPILWRGGGVASVATRVTREAMRECYRTPLQNGLGGDGCELRISFLVLTVPALRMLRTDVTVAAVEYAVDGAVPTSGYENGRVRNGRVNRRTIVTPTGTLVIHGLRVAERVSNRHHLYAPNRLAILAHSASASRARWVDPST